jgi:DNA-binding NarL/FixJ family response regulator
VRARGSCRRSEREIPAGFSRRRGRGPLDELTKREREVLEAMAEVRSNAAIGKQIFLKLELKPAASDHRRVLAILAYLRMPP